MSRLKINPTGGVTPNRFAALLGNRGRGESAANGVLQTIDNVLMLIPPK